MADGSVRTPGSGETIASDDIGGVKWQRMKMAVGADGAAVDVQPPDADGKASSSVLPASGQTWNGASWDRMRGNTEGTILASAARTVNTSSAAQTNYNASGVLVTLNVTVASGTGGLTVRIYGIDPVSAAIYVLNAAPTAVTATGITGYELHPGSSAGATGNVQQRTAAMLPRNWFVFVAVGDASSYTYSIGYALTH